MGNHAHGAATGGGPAYLPRAAPAPPELRTCSEPIRSKPTQPDPIQLDPIRSDSAPPGPAPRKGGGRRGPGSGRVPGSGRWRSSGRCRCPPPSPFVPIRGGRQPRMERCGPKTRETNAADGAKG